MYHEPMVALERSGSLENQNEFQTPFCNAILKEFTKQYPEKREAIKTVLKEIDAQAIHNIDVFQSTKFPGVRFSHSKLTVTQEFVEKLGSFQFPNTPPSASPEATGRGEETEGEPRAKRHDYFLFTAMNPPPGGHALTVQDVAIDRFIRLLPLVAGALSRGEKPPEANVYLLGDTTGLGGTVTTEWVQGVKDRGFDQDGELYAEFIKQVELKNVETGREPHIVLQGVSKGAVVAEKTSKHLPKNLLAHTQRLLDNPAGDHGDEAILERARKGLQVLIGYKSESDYHSKGGIMQTLGAYGGPFTRFLTSHLAKEKNIPEDSRGQQLLKWRVVFSDVWNLVKGSSLDTEETRSFIRRGIDDPVTESETRTRDVQEKVKGGIPVPFFSSGKSSEVPFKGRHFFIYDRYHRWSTILDFVKSAKNIKPEDWKYRTIEN